MPQRAKGSGFGDTCSRVAICIVAVGLLATAGAAEIVETRIGAAPRVRGCPDDAVVCSPDARHVAFPVTTDNGQCMVIDGADGPLLRRIPDAQPVFGPGSAQTAYVAETLDRRWCVVADGVPGPPFVSLAPHYVVFSPDGARVAYMAEVTTTSSAGRSWCVVADGVQGPKQAQVSLPVFSLDGRHLAYKAGGRYFLNGKPAKGAYTVQGELTISPAGGRVACTAIPSGTIRGGTEAYTDYIVIGRKLVVVDDVRGETHDAIGPFVFSPDGKHLAYAASDGGKWSIILDGVRSEGKYDAISTPVFSPDGLHHAYVAKRGMNVVVVDGKPGSYHDAVTALAFSADSRHVGYVARDKGRFSVWVDGVQEAEYEIGVSDFTFGPVGGRYAYVAITAKGRFVVVDGQPLVERRSVGAPVFSADGSRYAYVAEWPEEKEYEHPSMTVSVRRFGVVVDGVAGRGFEEIAARPLTGLGSGSGLFTSDGKHIAYVARTDGDQTGWVVVIDGVVGPQYDDIPISSRYATATGGGVAFVGKRGSKWCIEANGEPGREYDWVSQGVYSFDTSGSIEYIAIRGNDLLRVRHTPPPLPDPQGE